MVLLPSCDPSRRIASRASLIMHRWMIQPRTAPGCITSSASPSFLRRPQSLLVSHMPPLPIHPDSHLSCPRRSALLHHWPCRSLASTSRCARRVLGCRCLSLAAPSQRAPSRRRPVPVFSRNLLLLGSSLHNSGPCSSSTNGDGMGHESLPRPLRPRRS
jgi:hypothetical protein